MPKKIFENICVDSVFERIYNDYAKDLHDFLYYKFGNGYNHEDKMHEAFVKLWHKCEDVTYSKAKSFLFTVANNLMLNEVKHKKVKLKYNKSIKENTNKQSPEFLLEEKQYLEKYERALSSLTEKQRLVFSLCKIEAKPHKEVASLLDISTKTVEKHLYSALKKLKLELKEL
ncbi:RNA polymerase sigma factor [Mesonia sp. HuA40]|uniref:RNA polymerase sigma factor n=1 Tax=Mesonia sp. HuA40 TaxID=2602761 RepID=UPI0011C6FA6E|nr:RNA polymerase sigma factor [Mesonia sp. HuA40]TXK75286.1 RNA polymerase sigma factor [Mesonia sp. HuA40]